MIRRGVIDYREAWAEQERIQTARIADEIDDTVLLLEHPSVYTAGKRTQLSDYPTDGSEVVIVDRGGQITWHGPGQIVGYPIVKLPQPLDVVAHVRRLEQLMIDVSAEFGVQAGRVEGRTGAWVLADDRGPDRKIGAIGVRVRYRVTMHGFALNCNPDLGYFDKIVPCGISDAGVTSLSAELGREVPVSEVIDVVEAHLPTVVAPAS